MSIIGYYWLAALVYFLIIIIFLKLLKLLLRNINPSFSELILKSEQAHLCGIFSIVFVSCLILYGTINAMHPIIKTYNQYAFVVSLKF